MKTENKTKTLIYVALNMSKVVNNEESFDLMHKVGARVCSGRVVKQSIVGGKICPHANSRRCRGLAEFCAL